MSLASETARCILYLVQQVLSLNSYVIQFGTGLALLLAAVDVLQSDTKKRFSWFFFLSICLASIQLRLGLYADHQIHRFPGLTLFFLTSMFSIGPLLLPLVYNMTGASIEKMRNTFFLHLVPAAIVTLYDIYFNLRGFAYQAKILEDGLYLGKINVVSIFLMAGSLSLTGYFIYICKIYLGFYRKFGYAYNNSFWAMFILVTLGHIITSIALFLRNTLLYHIGADFIPVVLVYILLVLMKHPDFFKNIRREVKQKRYEKTQLSGIDVDSVKKRLSELMTDEHLYRDENLRIQTLAEELLLNRNQLSRILNESFQQNFYEFVNSYRIAEAKELLISQRDLNASNIAYMVGFNSVSAFNSQFNKLENCSPAVYRSNH